MRVPSPEELLELSDAEFRALVHAELAGRGDAPTAEALRHPSVLSRWSNSLERLRLTTNGQFEAREAELEAARIDAEEIRPSEESRLALALARESFQRWRAEAVRFRTTVEDRLLEAAYLQERLQQESEAQAAAEELEALRAQVAELEAAIATHRAAIHEDDAAEPDRQLWRLLGDDDAGSDDAAA